MKYYGIKTPNNETYPSYIYWVTSSEHASWHAFFDFPDKDRYMNPLKFNLGTGIKAYEAIGYKCVELEIIEKL